MIRRVLGALLAIIGALGIALSALGVIYVWRAADGVKAAADDSLVLVSDTLTDVDRSLDVASSTLDGAALAIDGLYSTTLDVSRTLSSTRVTVDEMAALAEDDLPQSIESSLVALEALEETAAVVDQLLRGLQRFGVGDYHPEIPLDQAVSEATAGLEPVPSGLRAMGAALYETSASLEGVQGGIVLMGDHIMGIRQNVVNGGAALSSHRANLRRLQTRVQIVRRNVDRPVRTAAWGSTLLLVWIGLSQLAIVRWGFSLWQRRRPQTGEPQETSSGEAS
ncbi:MAG: hypothetical protein PVF54_03885 [Anaerolineae bacterium]|jgi:hypothetical protein